MKLVDYIKEDVPEWALSYLVNSDASGLEDEEIEEIDDWYNHMASRLMEQYPCVVDLVFNDEEYYGDNFTPYPAFGKACNTVQCAFVAYVPEPLATDIPSIELDWE
jgi:hypothetical protein